MLKKEDKCKIEVCGEMSMERLASFQMLYTPLIGTDAATLYHTLLGIGTRHAKIKNHLLIANISRLSMELIEKSRRILEQYLLIKTFYDAIHNAYLYQIFMPKDGNDFLRHEVFGRLYIKEMGQQVYEFNRRCFAHDFEDKKDYQEITIPFENVLKEDWQDEQEELFKKMKPKQDVLYQNDVPLSFNFDRFLTGYSTMVFPLSARTGENLHAIGELATIHGISEMDMRKLVSQCIDLKSGRLNVEALKKKARNTKPVYDGKQSDPYGLPPVVFMQQKQGGVKVSSSDKFLIENLISEYKMKPEVVNVLIEYVLETTNQRFTRSYVEKVAGVWIRLSIDTKEKALAQIKEEKKGTRPRNKTETKELPAWFHDQDSVSSKDKAVDDEELRKMLEGLGGEQNG